jgi:hypothetical protein
MWNDQKKENFPIKKLMEVVARLFPTSLWFLGYFLSPSIVFNNNSGK